MNEKLFKGISLFLVAEIFIIWGFPLWMDDKEIVGLIMILFLPFVALGGIASLKEKHFLSLIGGFVGFIGIFLWSHLVEKTTGIHYITFSIFHLPFLIMMFLVIFFSIKKLKTKRRYKDGERKWRLKK